LSVENDNKPLNAIKSGGAVMNRIDGKVCLVTGAGSGIGAATAQLFAAAGGKMILGDINGDAVQRMANSLPGSRAITFDVATSDQANAAVQDIVNTEGRLDILVHFAGVDDPAIKKIFASFAETGERLPVGSMITDEQWSRMIRINLDGTFFMMRAALRVMQPNNAGSIVTMSSVAGIEGILGYAHYSAAKSGVIGLTRSFAKEFIKWGIRVNCVAPDPVTSPMSAMTPKSLLPALPIGRFAEPKEIAKAALFLASDDASYISGETIILAPGRLVS
jgi:NAD(P)-dependent dehydrogenase (short-subunit alcohol dehydrogenase family)